MHALSLAGSSAVVPSVRTRIRRRTLAKSIMGSIYNACYVLVLLAAAFYNPSRVLSLLYGTMQQDELIIIM
jgi:hypothetical protein